MPYERVTYSVPLPVRERGTCRSEDRAKCGGERDE